MHQLPASDRPAYLQAAGLPPCLLLDFGKSRPEIERVVAGL
jgi:hypothetical protein